MRAKSIHFKIDSLIVGASRPWPTPKRLQLDCACTVQSSLPWQQYGIELHNAISGFYL